MSEHTDMRAEGQGVFDPDATAEMEPIPAGEPAIAAPAVEAVDLAHYFGHRVRAVDGVSLRVESGEIFGLVGPDGAGKSTLIRMLATVLAPTAGDAFVFGESVIRYPGRVKPRIGYMSQAFSLYGDLTVAENLAFFAKLRGVPGREVVSRSSRLLEFAGLTEFARRQAQHLSGGMKQKLALAATLIHEPALLFLDEPTTGVDPVSRREFWRIIAGLRQRGITVFVATPYMDEAERCTHVAFMDAGRILLSETPALLKAGVPGSLFEIQSPAQREAMTLLAGQPWVLAATVYGDTVRIVVDLEEDGAARIAGALSSAGVTYDELKAARMDMETTFSFLAERAKDAARAAAEAGEAEA
jgi:ABC-2 type transport system ATP-binding protein